MIRSSELLTTEAVAPAAVADADLSGIVSSFAPKDKGRFFCFDDCLFSSNASKFINANECQAYSSREQHVNGEMLQQKQKLGNVNLLNNSRHT